MPEIIDKQVVGLGFGFFNDEEIKMLSVKQITNSFSFDTLRQPVRGGFYDRAFGALDMFEKCHTCGLGDKHCPGHNGHLQLAVPVYNVFMFPQLYRLLQIKCFKCHKLRIPALKKKILEAQLLYIQAGSIARALEVESLFSARATALKTRKDDSENAIDDSMEALLEALDKEIAKAARECDRRKGSKKLSMHDVNIRNKLIKNFMLACGGVVKCAHCKAISPKFRRDGFTKIFMVPSATSQKANMNSNIVISSVLSGPAPMTDSDGKVAGSGFVTGKNLDKRLASNKAKLDKERAKTAAAAAKKKAAAKRRGGGSDGESGSDDASDDDNETDMSEDDAAGRQNDNDDDDNDGMVAPPSGKNLKESAVMASSVAVTETTETRILLPNEVERHMQYLWEQEHDLVKLLFFPESTYAVASPSFNAADYRAFFHRLLLVPPSRLRPPRMVNGEAFDNDMNVSYRKIFDLNDEILRTVTETAAASSSAAAGVAAGAGASAKDAAMRAGGAAAVENMGDDMRNKVIHAWVQLQHQVNLLFDSEKTGSQLSKSEGAGIKQVLEKKQGLFRKHMMGKRVNFAARSVISPDPYLHTKEIGVPEIFAKVLTYPQPVTPYNVEELRQAVINGPDVHPGANSIIDGRGRRVDLKMMDLNQRTALAKTLNADASSQPGRGSGAVGVEKMINSSDAGDAGPKVVLRHLKSGDVLLVNRQPTLHKPSMMTHIARVLYNESTIRMHYANCNSYNADFDGDEINLHFPQNELARVEAYDICNNDNQYTVPTSGNPLRGLIQDHVVAGVRLTQRDAFLNKEFFQQFLYLGVSDSGLNAPLATPVPAILKPRALWTGKQVISCVMDHVTYGRPALNLNPVKAKVPGSSWGKAAEEDGSVIVRDNELVQGVIDKAQFGASKYGLVHAVYELYGAKAAGDLLTIFARLFTRVLQYDGFTCGMDDMLLLPAADQARQNLIKDSALAGIAAAAECAGLSVAKKEDLLESNAVNMAIQRFFGATANAGELLDGAVKGALNGCTSAIISACLPGGQRVPFPRNNMAMMTLSGAKGSMVNHSQISCLLGQQELEGRRVPTTQAGKTLPSFARYDPQPRAGGYISQRFFTGIRPQEYYFHCFAEDHQVLTDRGFLFGPAIERALAAGESLRFASYDPAGKVLAYEPATHFVRRAHDPAREPMVSVTHAAEQARWATDSCADSTEESNRVSLLVTGEHDLFLQSDKAASPVKVTAEELLKPNAPSSFKMFGYAENGIVAAATSAVDAVYARLNIATDVQRTAFNAFVGYWLSAGVASATALTVTATTADGAAYVRQLTADLGLQCATTEAGSEGRTVVAVTAPALLAVFAAEFGGAKTEKTLPSWWATLSVPELRALVTGLRTANGSSSSSSVSDNCIFTASVALRDELIVALLHAGYSAFFTRQSSETEAWAVHYTDLDRAAAPVLSRADVKSVAYTGDVWCVTVPPHGLIVTRRARCSSSSNSAEEIEYASRPMIVGNCMAGREGLVDTAVKTSRSGYLQRCLVKHLESLTVQYDQTVRDSDGSVVQFHYGEDSIDITKAAYLGNLSFLSENYRPLVHKLNPSTATNILDCVSAERYMSERQAKQKELADLEEASAHEAAKEDRSLADKIKDGKESKVTELKARIAFKRQSRFEAISAIRNEIDTMIPIESAFPPGAVLGAVAERFHDSVSAYVSADPDSSLRHAARAQVSLERRLLALEADNAKTTAQIASLTKAVSRSSATAQQQQQLEALTAVAATQAANMDLLRNSIAGAMTPEKFAYMMNLNFARCLVPPGENVGVLAAQSVGEPSTQMTLNTFHLAGHGGANVTLGIPRLREIIMTASDHMSTPIMEIPIMPGSPVDAAEMLAAKLNRISLNECIERIDVRQSLGAVNGERVYRVRVQLKDLSSAWAKKNLLGMRSIVQCVSTQMATKLNTIVRTKLRSVAMSSSTGVMALVQRKNLGDIDEAGNDVLLEGGSTAAERRSNKQDEEGVKDSKRSRKGQEHVSYDDDEEEEEEEEEIEDADAADNAATTDADDDSSSDNGSGSGSDSSDDDDGSSSKKSSKKSALTKASKSSAAAAEADENSLEALIRRLSSNWRRFPHISNVEFDTEHHKYFEVNIVTEASQPKLLMLSLIEKVMDQCLVRQTKNITKAVVLERSVKGIKERIVQTAGVNFHAVFQHPEADSARIKSNDIAALLKCYGVEAARAAIKEEVSGVFAVYGIGVDPRHLLLIADYMTFWGGYTPMNRMGMDSHASVLQKATFETSMKFILDSCMRGDTDDIRSPSSAIVIGKPIPSGTSAFGLLQPITSF